MRLAAQEGLVRCDLALVETAELEPGPGPPGIALPYAGSDHLELLG